MFDFSLDNREFGKAIKETPRSLTTLAPADRNDPLILAKGSHGCRRSRITRSAMQPGLLPVLRPAPPTQKTQYREFGSCVLLGTCPLWVLWSPVRRDLLVQSFAAIISRQILQRLQEPFHFVHGIVVHHSNA